jgi:hypothetical protein
MSVSPAGENSHSSLSPNQLGQADYGDFGFERKFCTSPSD